MLQLAQVLRDAVGRADYQAMVVVVRLLYVLLRPHVRQGLHVGDPVDPVQRAGHVQAVGLGELLRDDLLEEVGEEHAVVHQHHQEPDDDAVPVADQDVYGQVLLVHQHLLLLPLHQPVVGEREPEVQERLVVDRAVLGQLGRGVGEHRQLLEYYRVQAEQHGEDHQPVRGRQELGGHEPEDVVPVKPDVDRGPGE
uniref:Uncharacterized protein n=1 Tax=Spironucleus salmonicida TaxID=348837 RepID=V6LYC7_9EUKA|eukprot:EST48706.1 Hypothetical protein SS50377_11023 [Spironucleus salmonicida]